MTKSDDSRLKMAVIAGAAEAIKAKAHGNKSDDEILRHVTSKVDEIIENID
jgi:hypothetical protein